MVHRIIRLGNERGQARLPDPELIDVVCHGSRKGIHGWFKRASSTISQVGKVGLPPLSWP